MLCPVLLAFQMFFQPKAEAGWKLASGDIIADLAGVDRIDKVIAGSKEGRGTSAVAAVAAAAGGAGIQHMVAALLKLAK